MTQEVGLDNLSMRALARELDVPPMTIYHYAPSREFLHALVVDDILSEIRVPGPNEGTWEDRLRKLHSDARRVFAAHPGVSAHLGDGGSGEAARLGDGVLGILREGGFDSEACVVCFATLFTFMTGQIDLDAMAYFVDTGHLDGDAGQRDPLGRAHTRRAFRSRLRRRYGRTEAQIPAVVKD